MLAAEQSPAAGLGPLMFSVHALLRALPHATAALPVGEQDFFRPVVDCREQTSRSSLARTQDDCREEGTRDSNPCAVELGTITAGA